MAAISCGGTVGYVLFYQQWGEELERPAGAEDEDVDGGGGGGGAVGGGGWWWRTEGGEGGDSCHFRGVEVVWLVKGWGGQGSRSGFVWVRG